MRAEISSGALAQAMDVALAESHQAVDNAVRSVFELARSLEFLTDAIGRFNADTQHQIGEWQHMRLGREVIASEWSE
jgi:nicotinamidase-related amidase